MPQKVVDLERAEERRKRQERKLRFLGQLGRHISRLRKSKGYSMDRLALEADLSRATMSRIESGSVDPQAFTLESIAKTLKVPLSKLLDF